MDVARHQAIRRETHKLAGLHHEAERIGGADNGTFGPVSRAETGRSTDDATEERVQYPAAQRSHRLRNALPLPPRTSMGGHHRVSSRHGRLAAPSRRPRYVRRPVRAAHQCPARLSNVTIMSTDGALTSADYEWRVEVRGIEMRSGDLGVALHASSRPSRPTTMSQRGRHSAGDVTGA